MKKLFVTALVLTALLAVTAGTAFAGSALELLQVQNNGAGPTFTFRVTGEFSADELVSGFVQVDGGDAFPLYCAQTAADTVVCHATKKVGAHDVVVGFGGARFWVNVPDQAPAGPYCYAVYDEPSLFSSDPTEDHWSHFGDVCLDDPAYEAQLIHIYNPEYPSIPAGYDYEYWGNGVPWSDYWGSGPDTNPGEGFYYWFH